MPVGALLAPEVSLGLRALMKKYSAPRAASPRSLPRARRGSSESFPRAAVKMSQQHHRHASLTPDSPDLVPPALRGLGGRGGADRRRTSTGARSPPPQHTPTRTLAGPGACAGLGPRPARGRSACTARAPTPRGARLGARGGGRREGPAEVQQRRGGRQRGGTAETGGGARLSALPRCLRVRGRPPRQDRRSRWGGSAQGLRAGWAGARWPRGGWRLWEGGAEAPGAPRPRPVAQVSRAPAGLLGAAPGAGPFGEVGALTFG